MGAAKALGAGVTGTYHTTVRPALLAWERAIRTDRFKTAAVTGGTVALLVLAFAVAVDTVWTLPGWARVVGLATAATSAVAWIVPSWAALVRPPDLAKIGAHAEAALGLAPELLVTTVSQHERPAPGISSAIAEALAVRIATELPRLSHVPRLRRSVHRFAATFTVLAIAAAAFPQTFTSVKRFALPLADIKFAGASALLVAPGNAEVEQGGAVRVVVTLDRPPTSADAPVLQTSRDGGTWSSTDMSQRGAAGYIATLDNLQRDLLYRVRSGEMTSRVSQILVSTVPSLRRVLAEVVAPESLGGQPSTISPVPDTSGQPPQFRVPTGSRVTLRLSATEPLSSLTVYAPGLILPAKVQPGDPTSAEVRLPGELMAVPGASAELRFQLMGSRGATSWSAAQLSTLPDDDPTVRVLSPRTGTPLGPRDDIEVLTQADDDTAIVRGELRLTTPRGPTTLPLAISGSPRRWQGRTRVSLAPLGVAPGEEVGLTAAVTDSAGRTTVSARVALEISATAPDPLTAARVAALAEAAAHADTAIDSLTLAAIRLAELARFSAADRENAVGPARLTVAAATDTLAQLQRSLARAVRLVADPALADAIANLADATVVPASTADSALADSADASPPDLETLSASLRTAAASLRTTVAEPLRDLRRGDLAALLIGSREAARSMVSEPDADLALADDAHMEAVTRAAAARLQSLPAPETTAGSMLPGVLPARLELAWRIEALRPDSVPARAADLALAARAARKLTTTPGPNADFTLSLSVLDADNLAARYRRPPPNPDLALTARKALRFLAGEAQESPGPLAPLTDTPPPEDPDTRRAARLAELATEPRKLAQTLRSLPRPAGAQTAAPIESALRDLIRRLDATEGLPPPSVLQPRIEAFRAAAAAEARLADLDAAVRKLNALSQAAANPATAPPDLESAKSALRDAVDTVATRRADALRDELRRYVPELAPAAFAADRSLKPALAELASSIGDPDRTANAATVATAALFRVQREVDAARTAMTRRDPIAAARANLAAAASALRRRDPDTAAAARFTSSAAEALDTAADQSARVRSTRMLLSLSDLTAFASPPTPSPLTRNSPDAAPTALPDLAPVPDQYKDAVRAYFEKLPRTQAAP